MTGEVLNADELLELDASKLTGTIDSARIPVLNQNTTGNAATATKLANTVTINEVAFDGTKDITITAKLDADVIVPITQGGTGSDTAQGARTKLDVMSTTEVNNAISSIVPPGVPNASETVAGKAKIATSAIAQAGTNDADILTPKKLRDALNTTGAAPISACRAWVTFNGLGGTIKASLNVTSITKNATGDYTLEFTVPLPTAHYMYTTSHTSTTTTGNTIAVCAHGAYQAAPTLKTTTQFRIMCASSVKVDAEDITVGIFC